MTHFFGRLARSVLDPHTSGRILAACCLWLLLTAGVRPLMLPDEGRYVGIAWEMLASGNWQVPTLDGLPFFHKPPLFYWLTMVGLKLFGNNEWAGRLASTTGALLALVLVHAFVRKRVDRPTANLTAVILATQPFFFLGAQFANLDLLVAAMISITVVAGGEAVLALERGEPYRKALTACYVFAALGVLAKGLIGIVLPGAILCAWIVLRWQVALIPRLLSPSLILLFLAIAAPWFVSMQMQYPGFWDYFFVYHHFRRFAEVGFNNQQAFWFYVPVLLLFTLPWSPWIVRLFKRDAWQASASVSTSTSASASAPAGLAVRLLMALWVLGIVGFFSLPKSKLVGYILPAVPAFSYLLAERIIDWRSRARTRHADAWIGLSLMAASVLCVVLVAVIARHDPSGLSSFAARSTARYQSDEPLVILDEYQYDLPFYLGATRTPWVVGDWHDPEIVKVDNWRKEIYDAGQFDPQTMAANLISPEQLRTRLCAAPDVMYWFWGKNRTAPKFTFLADAEVVFTTPQKTLWRLMPARLDKAKLCGETPNSG